MVQEVATSAAAVEKEVGAALGTDASPEQTEVISEEAASQEPKSYEDWLTESLSSNEEWKTAHEASQEKLRRDSFNEVNSRLKPLLERHAQYEQEKVRWSQAAYQGIQGLTQRIEQLMEDGSFNKDTVRAAYQEHLGNLSGLTQLALENNRPAMRQEGINQTVAFLVDQALGAGTKTAKKHHELLNEKARPLSDVFEEILADVRAPLEAKIKSLEAKMEGLGIQSRRGQGPNMAGSAGGGGGRPTPAQYAAASSEQRREWREKGIEPLA